MRRCEGFSVVELLAVMATATMLLGFLALYLTPMETALSNGAEQTEALLRQARATAIATTSAYRVRPADRSTLIAETAPSCTSGSWTADPAVRLEFARGITLGDTSWTLCFSSRGMADANIAISLQHVDSGSKQIEVLRGGTTRVTP